MAMLTLMVSTVMHSTRHSETAPSASAAATTSVKREDATGALWPLKPVALDNRFMAKEILAHAVESPALRGNLAGLAGEIAAEPREENG